MSPQEIVTYGAGIIALFIIFGVFVSRQKGDESLDKRQQRAIDDRDETIKELHARNREISDRYHEAMQGHSAQILATVEGMRKEQYASMRVVHEKLAHTQRELEHCMAKHEECDKNVGDLRALIAKHIASE
jgi:hypothetical protein